MEATVTATLIVEDKKLYKEEDGEKYFLVPALMGKEEHKELVPVEAIISEYLIPDKQCRSEVKFHMRTIKEPGERLGVTYPFVTECHEVVEDSEVINTAEVYGYITNMGKLKTFSGFGENYVNIIIKFRSGKKPTPSFINVRAHGVIARRLVKEAKASCHLHVKGIISTVDGRIILDTTEIISLQESLTKKSTVAEAK